MHKTKILLIDKHQFGYLTDSYKWCQYLCSSFDVSVICFDVGLPRLSIKDVSVKYISNRGTYFIRGLRYLLHVLFSLFLFRGKIIVVYFDHCEVIKRIFSQKKMILDIRTLSVDRDLLKRKIFNEKIRKAIDYFDIVTVISKGVLEQLDIKKKKDIRILPLGADPISTERKNFDNIKLLYVGTLSGRDINKTIEGLADFLKKYPYVDLHYDIVGDGANGEVDEYRKLVRNLKLEKYVSLHGRLPYDKLKPFFDTCNIGVSFVPITDYFNDQPPTKTFEYILSGLYTIATRTKANTQIITSENGILITDSAIDFSSALEYVLKIKSTIKEDCIRCSLENYTWKNIVLTTLNPALIDL